MALIGLVTTEGLSYAATARANKGWFIYPTKFSVSDTAGAFNISRTLDDINPTWFTGLISNYNKINALTIELVGTIPINSNGGVNSTIAELYYYCETQSFNISCNTTTNEISFTDANAPDFLALLSNGDRVTVRIKKDSGGSMPNPLLEAQTYFIRKSGSIVTLFNSKADALANTNIIDLTTTGSELVMQKEFLYAIAQFDTPIPYIANSGNYTLRPSLVTANTADPNLFQFFYTQATDVNSHNLNPEAHPLIQDALNKAGVFVQLSEHDYVGQSFDEIPVFESGANTENAIVYVKANGKYEKALANGTISEINTIGVVKDEIVKTLQGFFNIGTHGFPVGSLVYLSNTVAGAFTTTATTCKLGIVVSATTVYLDKPLAVQVSASGVVNFVDLGDVPSAYTGNSLKFLRVNTGETGLEFVTLPDATETVKGLIELATEAETLAGTDTSRAVVPATLKATLNDTGAAAKIGTDVTNFTGGNLSSSDDTVQKALETINSLQLTGLVMIPVDGTVIAWSGLALEKGKEYFIFDGAGGNANLPALSGLAIGDFLILNGTPYAYSVSAGDHNAVRAGSNTIRLVRRRKETDVVSTSNVDTTTNNTSVVIIDDTNVSTDRFYKTMFIKLSTSEWLAIDLDYLYRS